MMCASADLAGLHCSRLPVWSATPGEESGLPLAVKTHTLGYEILSFKVTINCAEGCWRSKFIALIFPKLQLIFISNKLQHMNEIYYH